MKKITARSIAASLVHGPRGIPFVVNGHAVQAIQLVAGIVRRDGDRVRFVEKSRRAQDMALVIRFGRGDAMKLAEAQEILERHGDLEVFVWGQRVSDIRYVKAYYDYERKRHVFHEGTLEMVATPLHPIRGGNGAELSPIWSPPAAPSRRKIEGTPLMSSMSPRTQMLRAFGAALDADLQVSPMIVVGGADDSYPWIDPILDLARSGGMDAIYYRLETTDDVQDAIDWASSREEDQDDVRCMVLNVQGLGAGSLLDDALRNILEEGEGEHVVIMVVDPEQLAETRQDIRSMLGVDEALVPITWQGADSPIQEVQIVATATLAGKQLGRFFIAANVAEPYPHEVEIDLDMGDRNEEAALQELSELGPDRDFAVLAELRDGRIVARFDDIVRM